MPAVKEQLQIKSEERLISWNKIDDALYYEIYISKDISLKDKLNNDCYLSSLIEQSNSDIEIKNLGDVTSYELSDEDENLVVNVVAVEKKYNFRIVYEVYEYKKESSNLMIIIIIAVGSLVVLIGIIILVICLCKRRRKKSQFENKEKVNNLIQDLNELNVEEKNN